jgi:hypothetical protein
MSLVHRIWAEQVTENKMAEKDIVGGIFGLTPEMYQRSMAARDTATNAQLAQLTPGQLAGFYGMEAGTGLGRATQGLLGVEDPQLTMIRDVQQMRTQFDVSTPEGLRQFAQALSQKGYTDLAIQASQKAAEIGQKIGENINTLMSSGKYTPESLGVYAKTRNPADLVLIDTKTKGAEALLGGGKYTPASVAKYQQTGNIGDLVLVKGAAGEGEGGAGPVGKSGAWRDADGIVYSASEMQKQRAGFQQGEKLLENLNAIQPADVKNAESWIDWTQGENRKQIGGKVATKTVAAQAKINAAQLLKQIESLPPGSASNADMIAAKSSFPGYGDANALQAWIDDTKTKLQNSLNRQADQYGFKQRVSSGAVTPPPAAGSTAKKTVKFSDLPDSK